MVLYLNIDLMVSNDSTAKSVIQNKLSSKRHPLKVYNIFDAFFYIAESKSIIKWKDIKGLAKQSMKVDKYEKLNKKWHEKHEEI